MSTLASSSNGRGELRGKIVFRVMLYQEGPTVIQVARTKELKHVSPPIELMSALEAYAKKVVGRRKVKRKKKAKAVAKARVNGV